MRVEMTLLTSERRKTIYTGLMILMKRWLIKHYMCAPHINTHWERYQDRIYSTERKAER